MKVGSVVWVFMGRKYRVGVIYGDGIGPEIVGVTLDVLEGLGFNAEFIEVKAGYDYYRRSGKVIEDDGINILRNVDAILKGPITTPLNVPSFRSVNVMLRRELDLYANVRPFKSFKRVSLRDFNIVLIRENTEDLYVGVETLVSGVAVALKVISERACRRIVRYAFNYALKHGFKRVTVVHKSNILRVTDGLFRDIFFEESRNYQVEVNEMIVDTTAYNLVRNPEVFGVIVTENLYGDILADLLAGLVGSLGLCGSAEVGDTVALFEPVHGSAPDIAGKGIANPISQLISAKLMLEYLAERFSDEVLTRIANALELGIKSVVEEGKVLTPDLGGSSTTKEVALEVLRRSSTYLGTHARAYQ